MSYRGAFNMLFIINMLSDVETTDDEFFADTVDTPKGMLISIKNKNV